MCRKNNPHQTRGRFSKSGNYHVCPIAKKITNYKNKPANRSQLRPADNNLWRQRTVSIGPYKRTEGFTFRIVYTVMMWVPLTSKRFSWEPSPPTVTANCGIQENAFVRLGTNSDLQRRPIRTACLRLMKFSTFGVETLSIYHSLAMIKRRWWRVNKGLSLLWSIMYDEGVLLLLSAFHCIF